MDKTSQGDILKFIKKRETLNFENQNVEDISELSMMNEDNINKTCFTDNEDDRINDKKEVSLSSKCKSVEFLKNYKGSVFYLDNQSVIEEFQNNHKTETSKEKKTKAVSISRLLKFRRYFPQINKKEIVINYFSCALVRDILLQGHLYITANHFAFHSNVFGYVTNLIIPTSSVNHLSKKKTVKILPNAVEVRTTEGRQITFVNFFSRDSAFLLMSSVCPNILPDEIVSQTTVQTDAEEYESNCSITDFETVLFERSISNSTSSAYMDIPKSGTITNSEIVSLVTTVPMASRKLFTPTDVQRTKLPTLKRHVSILTEKLFMYFIALLTLALTFVSINLLYCVIDIEAKANNYHNNFKLGLNSEASEDVEIKKILNNLDQIEEVCNNDYTVYFA